VKSHLSIRSTADRRSFIGGSDARVIMGNDEATLLRLWREKRGEFEPEDLSDNLIVQLGTVTAIGAGLSATPATRSRTYSAGSSTPLTNGWRQRWTAWLILAARYLKPSSCCPWTFSEETAAEKHMAQLQHNMWVANARSAVLSIITGGGKWVEISVYADPLYQHLLRTAEKKF
jgi:hypothetical protein